MDVKEENQAESASAVLIGEPITAESFRTLAEQKRSVGDFHGALEALNRANDLEPNNPLTLQHRGETKRILCDYFGALVDFNLADHIRPNDAILLCSRGETKRILGYFVEALMDLRRANGIQPNDALTLCSLGATKRMLGDWKGSLEDLNRADALRPRDSFTIQQRGATKRALGDLEGAIEDYNRADEIQPNHAFTLSGRGETKLILGDYKGALEDLNRANVIEPNNAFTLQQRAIVRYHLLDYSGALEDIVEILKHHPSHKVFREWKNRIEEKIKESAISAKEPSTRASPLVFEEGVIQVPFNEIDLRGTILGEGGFGVVSLASWRGVQVALKRFKQNISSEKIKYCELKHLMQFRYKFISPLMGITTDPVTNDLILILEYAKYGSLYDLLFKQDEKLPRAEVVRIALDIALGVDFLHSHNPKVLHRDLKSANVLLYRKQTRAKISDFGTAEYIQSKEPVGTLGIALPPEMLAGESYDEKVDVFSFGVILYEMLTKELLPILEESSRRELITNGINDTQLKELVLECCAFDPKARPSMRQIVERLREMKNEEL